MEAYLKTFSDRTSRNIFWSASNYAFPKCPAAIIRKSCTGTARRKRIAGADICEFIKYLLRFSMAFYTASRRLKR